MLFLAGGSPDLYHCRTVDPLAEKYYHINPYAYVANNPIVFIDSDGRQIESGSQAEWDKQIIR